MRRSLLLCCSVVAIACLLTHVTMTGAMMSLGRYTCNCRNSHCPRPIVCRGSKYSCNCMDCSCYGRDPIVRNDDRTSFLQMLLRGGFSSSKLRRRTDWMYQGEE